MIYLRGIIGVSSGAKRAAMPHIKYAATKVQKIIGICNFLSKKIA